MKKLVWHHKLKTTLLVYNGTTLYFIGNKKFDTCQH